MKVAVLSRYQNSNLRGVETFVKELVSRLSRKHQVNILVGTEADSLSVLLKGRYDLVMPMNGRFQALKASLGRLVGDYRIVMGGHAGIGIDDLWNIIAVKPDVFVALTENEKIWAKKYAWGSKIIKIPNGIDIEKFKSKGEKLDIKLRGPVVLSVGALVWYKHHERTIEAVSLIPEASLLLVGRGELKDKLSGLGRKKLGGRFKIIEVDYQEIPKVYRSCDLFTLPSWDREAFGIVYLEAMASNLPVVAPDDSSRREIVGDAGILVDTSNRYLFADAITKALRKNWDNMPRKQAEQFSWDIVAKEYEKVINELVGK